MKDFVCLIAVMGFVISCGPNHEVNVDQGPGVREIHDEIELHFDEVTIGGVEYLILEKDRNNPDEGFGFMALKGNLLIQHSDSIIAYLNTMLQVQARVISKLEGIPEDQVMSEVNALLSKNLSRTSIKSPPEILSGKRKKSVQ